jgi:ppGpp synthetase/RelA/SpoT-type nucleotidyltranferase
VTTPPVNVSALPAIVSADVPLNLGDYEQFNRHPWIENLKHRFRRDSILAERALARLVTDLEQLNAQYLQANSRVLFTTTGSRYKSETSKLMKLARADGKSRGVTQDTLLELYEQIKDLAGARFSCPYFDEVIPTINNIIRPSLANVGYATQLQDDVRFRDKDYLDAGDEHGYRSYHFYVRIPTVVDIFKNVQMVLCEIQGRSELQDVWATKSHNLFYKPDGSDQELEPQLLEDMRQVSHSLRAADNFLVSIRKRVRGS